MTTWLYQPNGCKSPDSARMGPGLPQRLPQYRRMKEVSARIKINKLIPEYIKDSASLNQFVA
jgi:hypothetical protein